MAFTSFDRSGHRMLSAEITQELQALAQRHGLDITAGGGQIGADNLVIKVTARTNDTQAIEAKARQEIGWYGREHGLLPSDYGTVFTQHGKRFKFTGISPSRPKYPIDGVQLGTGKQFKFGASTAKTIIAARATAPTPAPQPSAPSAPSAPPPSQSNLDHAFDGIAQF